MIVFIVNFIIFIVLIFLLAKLRIYNEFDWKINYLFRKARLRNEQKKIVRFNPADIGACFINILLFWREI